MISRFVVSLRLFAVVLVLAHTVAAQTVPAPKDVIGFTPGEDRKLASWDRIIRYFKRLDAASDRVRFERSEKRRWARRSFMRRSPIRRTSRTLKDKGNQCQTRGSADIQIE